MKKIKKQDRSHKQGIQYTENQSNKAAVQRDIQVQKTEFFQRVDNRNPQRDNSRNQKPRTKAGRKLI